MSDLMPFASRQLGTETVQTVNARDLYEYLGVGKDYSSWIKAQVKRANLVENEEFVRFTQKGERENQWVTATEYHLTFDAAKHVAMMSRTAKGREVRAWFIAKEKELAAYGQPAMPQVHNQALQAIIHMAVQLDRAEQTAQAAQRAADEASQKADDANANALLAMRGQAWVTIRQYVTMAHLARQIPQPLQQQYGRWLTGLCRERGIPVYIQRSHEFAEENTYWISVIEETLPGWLRRRHGQETLHMVPSE